MNAVEYLQEIRATRIAIQNKKRALKSLEYMIEPKAINYDPNQVQTSPRQDGLEVMAIKHLERIEEIKQEINEKVDWLNTQIDEATDLISLMESEYQQEVLILRYIKNLRWGVILEVRGRTDQRSQQKLHRRAIDSFQKILDDHSMTTI